MLEPQEENNSQLLLRTLPGGYRVFDYPKEEARAVAERAAREFAPQFERSTPSVGIARQGVTAYYGRERGTPVLNFSLSDGNGSFGVVAERADGTLALEMQVSKGKVETGDGTFSRWDTELRTPDWELVATTDTELF